MIISSTYGSDPVFRPWPGLSAGSPLMPPRRLSYRTSALPAVKSYTTWRTPHRRLSTQGCRLGASGGALWPTPSRGLADFPPDKSDSGAPVTVPGEELAGSTARGRRRDYRRRIPTSKRQHLRARRAEGDLIAEPREEARRPRPARGAPPPCRARPP
jgi:hypothetical protein